MFPRRRKRAYSVLVLGKAHRGLSLWPSCASSTAAIVLLLMTRSYFNDAEESIRFFPQQKAMQVDAELMPTPGFSMEALMELSGLAVAAAVRDTLTPRSYPCVIAVIRVRDRRQGDLRWHKSPGTFGRHPR